jgi:hypothetical protein
MTADLTAENTEVAILGRVLEPHNGNLAASAARPWLKLKLPEEDEARLRELSSKAKRQKLSLAEQTLLENYLHVGRLIDLMRSKARLSLRIS